MTIPKAEVEALKANLAEQAAQPAGEQVLTFVITPAGAISAFQRFTGTVKVTTKVAFSAF